MPETESHQSVELVRSEPDGYILEQLQIAFTEVANSESAKTAEAAWKAASARVPALVTAQRVLNRQCSEFGSQYAESRDRLRADLVDLASSEGPAEALDGLIRETEAVRLRHVAACEALAFCVEHEQQRAGIEESRSHADWLDILASGIKRRADERLAKMVAQLADVAEAEACVSFDPSKTLAGALDRLAREYSLQASALRHQADDAARKYDSFCANSGLFGPRR